MLQPQRLEPVSFNVQASSELIKTAEGVILTLFPNASFGQGREVYVVSSIKGNGVYTKVSLADTDFIWEYEDQEIASPAYTEPDRKRRIKERVRLGILKVLSHEYKVPFSPWGILVGVRPTKLIHRFIDQGFSTTRIRELLTDVYALSPSRQDLVLEVATKQRQYFHSAVHNPISIYVGIPFCPTRCKYCSFAAYPLGSHSHLVQGFIRALQYEIKAIGKLLQELGTSVETVYVGGGTPTTIRGGELIELLELLNRYFLAYQSKEFTVEAGRPETLDLETTKILKQAGVQRVSINPQTMNDPTLKRIGRDHTAEQIRQAFRFARQVGIPSINADLIIGLPGEGLHDFEYTLQEVGKLAPENITIHSLALKRAAEWRKSIATLYDQQILGKKMAQLSQSFMKELGLNPYYLYRQRMIMSDLENIGYAKEGTESIYNIQMMEERQTIISLGGGGISKFISQDLTLVRHANPKCPATYGQQIEDIVATKKCQIRQYLVV